MIRATRMLLFFLMGGEVRQEPPASLSRFSHFFFPLSSLAFAALDLSYLILVGFVFFFSFHPFLSRRRGRRQCGRGYME